MLFNERADFLFNNVAIKTTGYIVVVVASESDYKLNKIKWCDFNTAFSFLQCIVETVYMDFAQSCGEAITGLQKTASAMVNR